MRLRSLASLLLAFAPVPMLELSTTAPGEAPAITSGFTQANGETPPRMIAARFPPSFTYNPAFAVDGCTAEQEAANTCPDGSRLGSIDVKTPFGNGGGPVHVTTDLRLIARITGLEGLYAERIDGRISAADDGSAEIVFDALPAIPINSAVVALDGGDRGLFVNPHRCGTHEIVTRFVSQDDVEVSHTLPVEIAGCAVVPRLRSPRAAVDGRRVRLTWAVSEAAATDVRLLRRSHRVWAQISRSRVSGTSLSRRGLRRGRYRALLRAETADGRTSRARSVGFRIR